MSAKNLNFMNSVALSNIKKSVFDLTHDVKLSGNMGYLIPVMVFDTVPGEQFTISNEALVRLAPLVSPMFHRVNVTMHTWAVPYRLLWDNYADWFTEKSPSSPPAFPFMEVDGSGSNYTALLDYLGIPKPTLVDNAYRRNEFISCMRLAAYQCVYNEFYRDQNLVPEVNYKLTDGDNTSNTELRTLRKRAWGHDYFTSNLPFAQKGEAVKMPIAGDAQVYQNYGDLTPPNTPLQVGPAPWDLVSVNVDRKVSDNVTIGNTLYADLGDASVTTVNEFRLALQLQKYLERAARAGTRLVEWIKGMFNETLPDYTAQRPQYIGGSKTPIQITEVLNTTGTTELPQGNMSGRAISAVDGKQGKYRSREHCVIITMMSVMPETTYQQGIERDFLKINDPKEYLNPLFAHLGEQGTYTNELVAFHTEATANPTFGYLPRYAEYRTIPNRVAGDFRDTLSYWTMSRIFDTASAIPAALNQQFIECDATHRVFADTDPDDQKIYVHVLNRVRAVRPLPKYGTPSI